jgi:uncharacterized protein YjdB
MKTLLHKRIVFSALLLLIGLFIAGPTVIGLNIPLPVYAGVTIYSSDADNRICPDASVTFTAIATGGTVISYNWYKNGNVIEGQEGRTYTTSSLKDGEEIYCIVWVGGDMIFSNSIFTRVGTNTPYVEITSNDADNIVCAANDDVTFEATTHSTGGGAVSYQWKINGIPVGYDDRAYRTTNLKHNDMVTCEITITGGECLTATSDVSNAIQMTVMAVANPSVSVVSDDADNVITQGTTVTFTASTLNTDGYTVNYRWTVNSSTVGSNQNTFTTNELKNRDIVECHIVVDGSGCWERNFNQSILIQMGVLELTGPAEICVNAWEMFSSTVYEGIWTSSDESIAYIDELEGSIKGVSPGNAIITYTVPGGTYATRTVKVVAPPNAGEILSDYFIICVGNSTTLRTSGEANGLWTSSNSDVAAVDGYSGLLIGISEGNAIITYMIMGTETCPPSEATYPIAIAAPPVAGVINGKTMISIGELDELSIQGNTRPGSWSSNNLSVATVDEASGIVTAVGAGEVKILYTVQGIGGCGVAIAEFDIVVAPADAGELSGNQEVCEGRYTIFSSTVPGGTWTTSNSAVATVDGGFVIGVSAGDATITYTVAGGAFATRSVTVKARPGKPTFGIVPAFCSGDNKKVSDLEAYLAYTGTLSWYDNTGTKINDPSTTVLVDGGIYNVSQTENGCEGPKATIKVAVNNRPGAPTVGTVPAFCSGDNKKVSDLAFYLTYTGVLNWYTDGDVAITDPATTVLVDGTTYKVSQTISSCEGPKASIIIAVNTTPGAPTGSATQTFCSATSPTAADLVATGANIKWYNVPSGGTALESDDEIGTGTYHASQTVNGCESKLRLEVAVTVAAAPNAGTNGTLSVCSNGSLTDADLYAALKGTPDGGGSWTYPVAPMMSVGMTPGSTVPIAGVYTYTVYATSPCSSDATATVTVTVQLAPNAGENGTLTVCEGATPTDEELFKALNGSPDNGGSWTGPVAGVYTYTVTATSPCAPDASATVTITEQAAPNAGQDGALTVCEGTTPTNEQLFEALEGIPDAGGSWSDPVDGVYTYTVFATSPCALDATAKVTVTKQTPPNAGENSTLTVCSTEYFSEKDLFEALGGKPEEGGTWKWPEGEIGLKPIGPIAGDYTYTVEAKSPCAEDAIAIVTVVVQQAPNAGLNGQLTVCVGTKPTPGELFEALKGTPDGGGSWSEPVGGVYTYTVKAVAPCANDATATVTVTEQAAPNAGTHGTLTVCSNSSVTESALFDALGGDPEAGGTWTVPEVVPGMAVPNGAGPIPGDYTYTVKSTLPCTMDATATVTVTVQLAPNAGQNGTLSVCSGVTPTKAELFEALEGTPDAGGSWSAPASGVYTYTVTGTSPCSNASATVTLTTLALPAQPSIISGESPVCQATVQIYSVTEVAGITYEWSIVGTGWEIQSGQGGNSIKVLVGSANAIISVVAINSYGCTSIKRSRTIIYLPAPIVKETYINDQSGTEITINYGCESPVLKVVDKSGNPLYSYQWFRSTNPDGSDGLPVSAPVTNLFKGNQYRVPPANGYYDPDYGDQKGIGVGTHYYYVVMKSVAGCTTQSPVFRVVVKPAEALGDYDAKSYYTGPRFVWTTTTTSNTATATLTAFIRNRDNETCGDIATARVSFEFRTSTGDWTKVPNGTNLPVGYVDPRDPAKGGTASVIAQLSIPQNQNSENYDIRVLIGGNYYNASTSQVVSICQLVVGKVVPGGSIAGGVNLPNLNGAGYVKGTSIPPSYLCFGVEYVQKGKSVSSPKGRVTLRIFSMYDRTGRATSDLHTYVVRSNAIAGLSINGNKATFTAKSNIAEEIPDMAYPGGIRVEAIEGNCVMTMTVEDWCSTLLSNVLDKVGITIQRNAGGIWYSNNWIKSKAEPACIFGGDILVIAPSTTPVKSGTSDMNSRDATVSYGDFNVKVFGNPSSTLFNVAVIGSNDKVVMRVVDISGRLVETRTMNGNSNVQFGMDLRPGTYYAEFIQGNSRKTVTLIKNIR